MTLKSCVDINYYKKKEYNQFEPVLNWSELVNSPTSWTARTQLQFDAVGSSDWLQLQFCENLKNVEPVGLQFSNF